MTTATKNGKTSLENLHRDQQAWLRHISFMNQELSWLKERLEEIASKNNSAEMGRWIESYQNRFLVQKENLDILRHDTNEALNQTEAAIKASPTHIHENVISDLDVLRDRVENEEKLFIELKTEFSRFLAKHL